jgi:hypothetical protein
MASSPARECGGNPVNIDRLAERSRPLIALIRLFVLMPIALARHAHVPKAFFGLRVAYLACRLLLGCEHARLVTWCALLPRRLGPFGLYETERHDCLPSAH